MTPERYAALLREYEDTFAKNISLECENASLHSNVSQIRARCNELQKEIDQRWDKFGERVRAVVEAGLDAERYPEW